MTLKLSDVKPGDMVELDGGFTCADAGRTEIYADEVGQMYFHCAAGRHYLDGCISESGNLIGVSK